MRKHCLGLVATAVVLVIAAPAIAKEDKPIGQIIEAGHKVFVQGFLQGDAKMVASAYAPKAALLPPNGIRLEGLDAIEKEATSMGKVKFELKTVEAKQIGGTAWSTGVYKILLPDGKIADEGKYMEIWTQTDKGWKIWRDIWNSDKPAAAPAK